MHDVCHTDTLSVEYTDMYGIIAWDTVSCGLQKKWFDRREEGEKKRKRNMQLSRCQRVAQCRLESQTCHQRCERFQRKATQLQWVYRKLVRQLTYFLVFFFSLCIWYYFLRGSCIIVNVVFDMCLCLWSWDESHVWCLLKGHLTEYTQSTVDGKWAMELMVTMIPVGCLRWWGMLYWLFTWLQHNKWACCSSGALTYLQAKLVQMCQIKSEATFYCLDELEGQSIGCDGMTMIKLIPLESDGYL